jgi:hypothetical protein
MVRYVVMTAVAAVILAGCGAESAQTSDPPVPTHTPTKPVSSPSNATGVPLTIIRNGGFVGFADRIEISADGVAKVSRRGTPTGRCQVETRLLAALRSATSSVDWSSLGDRTPGPRHPDDLVIAVAANGGVARLDDSRVRPLVDPVGKLLADAYTPAAKRQLCRQI